MNKRIFFILAFLLVDAKKVVLLDERSAFPTKIGDQNIPKKQLCILTLDTDTQAFEVSYYARQIRKPISPNIAPKVEITLTSITDLNPKITFKKDDDTILILNKAFADKFKENNESTNLQSYECSKDKKYKAEYTAFFHQKYKASEVLLKKENIDDKDEDSVPFTLFLPGNKEEEIKMTKQDTFKFDNKEKGWIGETLSSMNMYAALYTKHYSKYGSDNGVDGIFTFPNTATELKDIQKTYYIESKCHKENWTKNDFSHELNDEVFKNKLDRFTAAENPLYKILQKAKSDGSLTLLGQCTNSNGYLLTPYERKPQFLLTKAQTKLSNTEYEVFFKLLKKITLDKNITINNPI